MSGKPIRILQIVGNARLGGVVTCLLNYFRHIDRERYHFDFVTYGPSPFDDEVKKVDPSVEIHHISPFQKNFIKGISDLEKVCRRGGYDIAHSHLTTLSAFSLAAADNAGVPVRICHAHSAFNKNSEHYLVKSFLRPFAVECATHLMACSRHAAESIFGRRAEEAVILPNAIEAEKFFSSEAEYRAAREKFGLSGKVVLYVGRFAFQKNLPFLVRAFAAAADGEDMTLVLVGDGAERKAILKAAGENNLADKLRLVPPCDPTEWYKAADIFCMPSRYEGLGIAAIEAQTAGLKCLLSQAVPKEADVTGRCEFLPDDESLWAQAIAAPAGHCYDQREAVAAAGYDISEEAVRLTDFYESAVNGIQ